MRELERLDEALENASCWMAADYGDQHNDPDCDACRIDRAARAYRDLLANGQRVEPDYEAAYRVMFPDMHLAGSETTEFDESWCRSIVDAAIGDRSVYPKEAEK